VSYGCHHCGGNPLCEPCVTRWIEVHTGNAQAIGRAWGTSVAHRVPPPRPPWPAFDDSPIVRAKAVQKIGYLAGPDARCRLYLARICAARQRPRTVWPPWRSSTGPVRATRASSPAAGGDRRPLS